MFKVLTNNLGFPRIGARRELKRATEAFWANEISEQDLLERASSLKKLNWKIQKDAGIDLIPSNDFSFYDQMLDMSCIVGAIPPRFNWNGDKAGLDILFSMARGISKSGDETNATWASEMTKWFDTNYHYIVPEFDKNMKFELSSKKIFDEFKEALAEGIKTKPVLIGPVTYLLMGKVTDKKNPDFDKLSLLDNLLPVYKEILQELENLGAEWVQLDEPVYSLDLNKDEMNALQKAYQFLNDSVNNLNLMVATYFGELRENISHYLLLPVEALHIDAVRGVHEMDKILESFPDDKILSIGVVDGRNIWKNDFENSLQILTTARKKLGSGRIMVAPSCSLIHTPVTLKSETKMDDELKSWMAFAEEKLDEMATLTDILNGVNRNDALDSNRQAHISRRKSTRIHNPAVKSRCAAVQESDMKRNSVYTQRRKAQRKQIDLPDFPITTIGSFPQTGEIRVMRAKYKKNEISAAEYENFLKAEIEKTVRKQEEMGIDMLVHGEFERNDMVEYFGEQLNGFTFSQFGWVQSFGSRYVKPPIIFGDVSRPGPMTVRWSKFAQSLTSKPMKGMITGPVTILQWSFVRDDQPGSETTKQIALALRDEVIDLEKAGIRAIQIDEPALREGLPLRKVDWKEYLNWAVNSFRLTASGVTDSTQIHTHMCYSEFNDIIDSIAALDADVISIETSRSNMELLDAFVEYKYPNEIGPGVYDIHSPRIPEQKEMEELLLKAQKVLPRKNIWVNPDCGLKTRSWEEVIPSLNNMVKAAKKLRKSF